MFLLPGPFHRPATRWTTTTTTSARDPRTAVIVIIDHVLPTTHWATWCRTANFRQPCELKVLLNAITKCSLLGPGRTRGIFYPYMVESVGPKATSDWRTYARLRHHAFHRGREWNLPANHQSGTVSEEYCERKSDGLMGV